MTRCYDCESSLFGQCDAHKMRAPWTPPKPEPNPRKQCKQCSARDYSAGLIKRIRSLEAEIRALKET